MPILNCADQTIKGECKSHLRGKKNVARVLSKAGHTVEYEVRFDVGSDRPPYWADIHLPKHNVVIEINGRSHWSARRKSKDRGKKEALEAKGQKVIAIDLSDALDFPEWILKFVPNP